MTPINVGQFVYKKVAVNLRECDCSSTCTYKFYDDAVCSMEVIEPGFIADQEFPDDPESVNTLNKGRVRAAKVLSIVDKKGIQYNTAYSIHDKSFEYRVGDVVRPEHEFCTDNVACASGIHCFETVEQAWNYDG